VETVVDRGWWPVDGRAILPASARAQHLDNAAQHSSVINPSRTRLISWQQRLDDCPLPITEPKLARHVSSSTVFKLESHHISYVNSLIGFGA
jgi:hypothetical protein